MDLCTHRLILLKAEEDGSWVIAPNKAKYKSNDKVRIMEYRYIVHAEEDARYVKRWFCF